MNHAHTLSKSTVWALLGEVADPEIPVLNVVEMGIIRKVSIENGEVTINMTPTYSGCPAMNAIENEIRRKLHDSGAVSVKVLTDYRERWTTAWMTDQAKKKLKAYGIAPPGKVENIPDVMTGLRQSTKTVPCPNCNSTRTELRSEFGSTPCKSQHYCNECHEPFEHFKCI